MYNLSKSLIAFEVVQDQQTIHRGEVPFDLLDLVLRIYNVNVPRSIKLTIGDTEWVADPKDEAVLNGNWMKEFDDATHIYYLLNTEKRMFEASEKEKEDLLLLQENMEQARLASNQAYLEKQVEERNLMLQESLEKQQLITAEHKKLLEDEQQRLDLLRVQTVQQVAVDPTFAVAGLMSEVGSNGDVIRQIAQVMKSNLEITKLVVASTSSLWINKYEIMDVIAMQSLFDDEIATSLKDKLPEDSLLLRNLKNLGKIN